MSDVRARAEERRKKILARQNKQVFAAGGEDVAPIAAVDDSEVSTENKEVRTPERPLASRRQYVRSLSEKTMTSKVPEEDSKETEHIVRINASDDDPGVESIDEVMKRSQNSTTSLTSESTGVTPNKKPSYTTKTVKELEADIAANNKIYDDDLARKSAAPVTEKKVRPKVVVQSNIQPSSIMRLIRLILIVAVGVVLGFQTVMTSQAAEVQHRVALATSSSTHSAVLEGLQPSRVESADDEFSPDLTAAEEEALLAAAASGETRLLVDPSASSEGRTWMGYVVWKLRSQAECTLSAVALVWWASRNLSPLVTLRFKNSPAASAGSYMSMALNLWQTGFEGLFEHAYSLLGELALYVAVLVAAVVGFTVLYSGSVGGTLIDGGGDQMVALTQVAETVAAVISGGGAEGVASEL